MTANESTAQQLHRKIRLAILITIFGLIVNGMTAVPLRTELSILLSKPEMLPSFLAAWWNYVNQGVHETSSNFMRYGFDWLGFAHLLIAIAFIGPLRDPVKNEWVIQWGKIISGLSVILALGWEWMRAIPFWWSLIDASISLVAFIILWLCGKWIQQLKAINNVA